MVLRANQATAKFQQLQAKTRLTKEQLAGVAILDDDQGNDADPAAEDAEAEMLISDEDGQEGAAFDYAALSASLLDDEDSAPAQKAAKPKAQASSARKSAGAASSSAAPAKPMRPGNAPRPPATSPPAGSRATIRAPSEGSGGAETSAQDEALKK
eukprot:2672389-Pyramimonas_sp.AAC.1